MKALNHKSEGHRVLLTLGGNQVEIQTTERINHSDNNPKVFSPEEIKEILESHDRAHFQME